MTLTPELRKMFKERALNRRKEFLQKKCCMFDENEGIDRTKLIDCLTRAKELISDYEGIYSEDVNDPRIKPPAIRLNLAKKKYEIKYDELDENKNSLDLFKLRDYLKNVCEYISEYENFLKELGCKDFD